MPALWVYPCGHLYRECCARKLWDQGILACPQCVELQSVMTPLHITPVASCAQLAEAI